MRRLLAGKAQIKIAAIGSAMAAALKEHGLFADIVPKIYNAGELGKTLAENISEYSAVTIFRAEEGSLELLSASYGNRRPGKRYCIISDRI